MFLRLKKAIRPISSKLLCDLYECRRMQNQSRTGNSLEEIKMVKNTAFGITKFKMFLKRLPPKRTNDVL